MPSTRARVARTTFGGVVRGMRRYRERDTGPIGGDAPDELFEAGAIEVREALERLTATPLRPPGIESWREPDAPVPTWWFRSSRHPDSGRVVLYLHGGAYVAGSHRTHRGLAAAFVRTAAARVCVPDYRLAPEHRFPAAVEDAVATYRWLLERCDVPPGRIALAGDSAGGGLVFATALAARDEGLPLPAGLVGLSPWTDLTASGGSLVTNDHLDIWLDGDLVAPGARIYAGGDVAHPYASPLLGDLAGLPPTLVHVGGHEILLDDAVRMVDALRRAGVDASLGVFEGMWHVFQAIPGLPESTRSLRELGAFVRRVTTD